MSIEDQKQIFSANLLRYLAQSRYNQREFADLLEVSEGSVSDWLYGRTYPRMNKIQKMAEIFQCEKLDLIEKPIAENVNIKETAKMLIEDPQAAEMFRKFCDLDEFNRSLVSAFIDTLRGKQI